MGQSQNSSVSQRPIGGEMVLTITKGSSNDVKVQNVKVLLSSMEKVCILVIELLDLHGNEGRKKLS